MPVLEPSPNNPPPTRKKEKSSGSLDSKSYTGSILFFKSWFFSVCLNFIIHPHSTEKEAKTKEIEAQSIVATCPKSHS